MKRTLFLILALCTLSTASWGAVVTETYVVADTASKYSWESMSQHPNLHLGANISINATHDPSAGSTNGTYSSKWYAYSVDNNGEFSITAREGCWIQSIGIVNSPTNSTCIYPKGGTSADKVADDGTAYAVNAHSIALNVGLGTKAGNARISQFSVTYQGEYFKQKDVTIGIINQGYKNVNLSSISGDAPLSYGSSNEAVATVSDEGVITPVGEGQTTITAYYGANKTGYSTSYTLHVKNDIYYEAFSPQAKTSSTTTSLSGDMFEWTASSTARRTEDTISTGQQGVYLMINNYIQTNSVVEGGVKSLKLNWRQFSTETGNTLKLSAQWGETTVELFNQAAETYPSPDHVATKEIEMTSNSQLKILNTSNKVSGGKNCRIITADILFTPYLLFVNKNQSVDCASASTFNFSPYIVNNTGATPTYTIADDGGTGCVGNFTGSVLDLSDVCKDGDIVVKATWGDVYTTTTLHVTALPAPTSIELNVPATMNATVNNRFQIIGTLTPANANPNVEWSSSTPGIVSVDQNGMISVLDTGEATITLKSKADESVLKSCTITASMTTDEPFIESYTNLGEQADWKSDYTQFEGTYNQLWRVRNFRHSSATELSSGVSGVGIKGGATNFIAYANANIEGGVKRVAFQWRAVDATKPVNFDVDDAGDAANTKLSTRLAANSKYANVQSFSRDVNRDKNYQFRITVADAASSNIVVGPITVTPYLLYKTKSVSLSKQDVIDGNYKYTNDNIINNTGDNVAANFTYTISGTNADKIAKIKDEDVHTGIVTILGKGTVTVTATWGEVSTSYQLTISDKLDPLITLEDPASIDVFGSYTPVPVVTIGDEVVLYPITYSSDNDKVAKVESNQIIITGVGEAAIQAKVVSTDFYEMATKSVPLKVTKPAATVAWNESFTDGDLETTTGFNKETDSHPFNGKDKVMKWQVRNYQYTKANADKVNGEDGIRIRTEDNGKNYIATNSPYEGGIKSIFFNWRMPGDTKTANFTVSVGNTYTKTITSTATSGEYYPFVENEVNCASNQMLKITINADEKSTIFAPMTIKPYLLYTTKNKKVTLSASDCTAKGYKYKNTDLIDNTDDHAITYAISGDNNDKIAKLNTSTGELNLIGKGKVTITAKWNEDKVTTTYDLEITEALTPTVELATPAPVELDGSYVPAPQAKLGDYVLENTAFTYSSSNENVAKVVDNQIVIRSPGTTTIRATLTASAPYYNTAYTEVTLTVKDYTPTAGTYFEETFSGLTSQTSYTENTTKFNGDKKFDNDVNIYKWEVYNYRTGWSGTKIAIRNKDNKLGYTKMDGTFEGGIKFVAFDWKSSNPTGNIVYTVSVNEEEVPIHVESSTSETYRFAHFFNVIDDEINLKIQTNENTGIAAYPAICPVTIMPYLLYTRKAPAPTAEELAAANYKYENKDIINNTGVALSHSSITFSIVESGKENVATINANTGEVTVKGAGEVTVKATWTPDANEPANVVTTTYELTVPKLPATVTYDNANITVADTIPLPVAKCNGEVINSAVYNYTTDNDAVIKVSDDKHSLIMVGTGTATITATLQESKQYQGATAVEATIQISSAPANKCFKETFSNLSTTEGYVHTEQSFAGDQNVYSWLINHYNRDKTNRFRFNNEGYVKMNGEQEGGIKYVWLQYKTLSTAKVDFTVGVSNTNNDRVYFDATEQVTYTYQHCFNEKSNASLSVVMANTTLSYAYFYNVTIVPYLLYTEKTHTMNVGEKYTNNNLIDNRDNSAAIEYSILDGGTGEAEINTSTGEIFAKKAGTVIVQAQWGSVTTTYTVTIGTSAETIIIDENCNFISNIAEAYDDDETTVNVTLNRNLKSAYYNSICLPFAMTETMVSDAFGEGTRIAELVDLIPTATEGDVELFFEYRTAMAAGVPYLIRPAHDFTSGTFEDVLIESDFNKKEGGKAQMHCIVDSTSNMSFKDRYFMSTNDILIHYTKESIINNPQKTLGLRAYFTFTTSSAPARVRCVFDRRISTDAAVVNGELKLGEPQKVMINGHLYIIREGKTYDAQGRLVK